MMENDNEYLNSTKSALTGYETSNNKTNGTVNSWNQVFQVMHFNFFLLHCNCSGEYYQNFFFVTDWVRIISAIT